MPSLPEQLAAIAARTRAWAQAQAQLHPSARLRLARPLEAASRAEAVAQILGTAATAQGGSHPQPPWAESLEAFQRQIGDCQRCPLGGKRRKLVFGEGPSHAPLAFVGDAPGPEEDASGRPFAGSAGQLLDRMIAAMGFKRGDVYLANLLKCRGQAQRPPSAEELEACRPYLEHQLSLLRPQAIISLGASSSRLLCRSEKPLAELRGHWHQHGTVPVMPTFHPADLLQDPGLKRFVWDDLKLVMKRLKP
jgi:DNA polymerase